MKKLGLGLFIVSVINTILLAELTDKEYCDIAEKKYNVVHLKHTYKGKQVYIFKKCLVLDVSTKGRWTTIDVQINYGDLQMGGSYRDSYVDYKFQVNKNGMTTKLF